MSASARRALDSARSLLRRGGRAPALSVVVVVHDMAREAPRTLHSLSPAYQRDIDADAYEVLVVDNASSPPLNAAEVTRHGPGFRHLWHDDGTPSPAGAINFAVGRARGRYVCIYIDGARIATPGLLHHGLAACRMASQPLVATLNWHLGPKPQHLSVLEGYSKEAEDRLLAEIGWPGDGYRLHERAALGGSSAGGYLSALSESNALFLPRERFHELGGYDERFDSPGGGAVNLDFYKRACERADARLFVLLGEGTFHQLHGGAITNAADDRAERLERVWAEYESLRGEPFAPPRKEATLLGPVPDAALPDLAHSVGSALLAARRTRQARRGVGPEQARRTPPAPSDDRPRPGDHHYRAWVGPPENYDVLAALQFNLLTRLGLREHHTLLDIGCGSLRAGRLLIPYLQPGRYHGLEPERWAVEEGIRHELGDELVALKRPRFAHNADFDLTPFATPPDARFDFVLAQSVLTHAAAWQVQACLRAVAEHLAADGIVAATFLAGDADYLGREWQYPGVTYFTPELIQEAAALAGLECLPLRWSHPGVARPTWVGLTQRGRLEVIPEALRGDWSEVHVHAVAEGRSRAP